jgi:DNA polymerase-3 subunit gamma/tau
MTTNPGYLVFARKWRPKTFDEVVGQQHVVRSLKNAITMNRVAGAYLFSGMRGVGKTSMARIFARSINCENGPTITPCGECKNCVEIAGGSSLDVVEIDAASNNGVDEVRDLRERVQYAPANCRKKIYIIDEVHMLSTAAFNAFLKTLEEPPPHTVFIMATTEQNKIPETVLSRCQCFEFRAISDSQIAERLREMAEKEKMEITPGALMMVARRAEGSMRDAQSLLDQASAYGGGLLNEDALGLVLGLVSREKTWDIMRSVIARDADTALERVRGLYFSGFDAGVIIRELCDASRTLAVAKVSGSPEKILDDPPDMIKSVVEMVGEVSIGRLQQFYDILLRAKEQTKSGNPLSVLEMAMIKMVRLDDVIPVSEILDMLRTLPSGEAAPISASVSKPPVRPAAVATRTVPDSAPDFADEPMPPPEDARLSGPWDVVKAAVTAKRPMFGVALDKALDFSIVNGQAVITYSAEQKLPKAQCEANKEMLETEIEKVFGKKMSISIVLTANVENAASRESDEKKTDYERKVRKEMMNHPMIQKAVDMFDGRPGFDDDGVPGSAANKVGGNGG